MDSKIAYDERMAFSARLLTALKAAGFGDSPTEFCDNFNLVADGATVTVHGARKWLRGESVPTQERILILAHWLRVSAQWLRFGEGEGGASHAANDALTLPPDDMALLRDLHKLEPRSQQVVRDLVASLLRNTLRS